MEGGTVEKEKGRYGEREGSKYRLEKAKTMRKRK